jgi:hypothetical protein
MGWDRSVSLSTRHRRSIAWACAVALLLLGLVAQHHALEHALAFVQAPAQEDAQPGPVRACEHCPQFAACDAALTMSMVLALPMSEPVAAGAFVEMPLRAEAFTAYVSHAPPQRG